DHHRLAGAPQQLGDVGVHRREARAPVGDQEDHLGLLHRELRLLPNLREHDVIIPGDEAAGVDDGEEPSCPVGVRVVAIAGDAGEILDQGLATPGDAVEQGALAHVGTAHDGDHRQRHHSYPSFLRPATVSLQRGSTFTSSDRYTFVPNSRSMERRAPLPIVLSICPCLPITIAFWLSRSTWIEAAMRTRPPNSPGFSSRPGSRSDSSKASMVTATE